MVGYTNKSKCTNRKKRVQQQLLPSEHWMRELLSRLNYNEEYLTNSQNFKAAGEHSQGCQTTGSARRAAEQGPIGFAWHAQFPDPGNSSSTTIGPYSLQGNKL